MGYFRTDAGGTAEKHPIGYGCLSGGCFLPDKRTCERKSNFQGGTNMKMKKLISIDGCFVALASAIGYGLGYAIPEKLGCGSLISMLICMTLGSVPGAAAAKIVFSKYIQEKKSRRIIAFAVIVAVFSLAYLIGLCFHYNLFEELFFDLGWEIIFPIVGFVVYLVVSWLRVKRIRSKYGDGSEGFQLNEKEKASILQLNGENREITGEYDMGNAAKTENGIFVCEADKKVRSWRGIPYAKAPVGDLRWKAPEAPEKSDRVFEAKKFGPSALQAMNERNALQFHMQSEDCLYLNIWAAVEKKPSSGKEVILYIHGGDFTYGGSADPIWDGYHFAEKHPETVIVSFNYRLGLMGFVDFSAVSGGEKYPDAANLGLLDQIAALKWVKNNIAAFGGDPKKITLMGDSAGATSIALLSLCKESNSLFSKAVILSGNTERLILHDRNVSMNLADALKQEFSAANMDDLIMIPESALKEFTQKHYEDLSSPLADGNLFPADLYQAALSGQAGNIEFVIGFSDSEFSSYRAIVGDEAAAALADSYISDFMNKVGTDKADALRRILEAKEAELGKNEARIWLINRLYNIVGMIPFVECLSKAGNSVHCFYWNTSMLVEKLGSGSVHMAAAILSNVRAGETLGYVVNKNVELILQALLMKFVQGKEVELSNNELKGVSKVTWSEYPYALSITDDAIVCTEEYEGKDTKAIQELSRIVLGK